MLLSVSVRNVIDNHLFTFPNDRDNNEYGEDEEELRKNITDAQHNYSNGNIDVIGLHQHYELRTQMTDYVMKANLLFNRNAARIDNFTVNMSNGCNPYQLELGMAIVTTDYDDELNKVNIQPMHIISLALEQAGNDVIDPPPRDQDKNNISKIILVREHRSVTIKLDPTLKDLPAEAAHVIIKALCNYTVVLVDGTTVAWRLFGLGLTGHFINANAIPFNLPSGKLGFNLKYVLKHGLPTRISAMNISHQAWAVAINRNPSHRPSHDEQVPYLRAYQAYKLYILGFNDKVHRTEHVLCSTVNIEDIPYFSPVEMLRSSIDRKPGTLRNRLNNTNPLRQELFRKARYENAQSLLRRETIWLNFGPVAIENVEINDSLIIPCITTICTPLPNVRVNQMVKIIVAWHTGSQVQGESAVFPAYFAKVLKVVGRKVFLWCANEIEDLDDEYNFIPPPLIDNVLVNVWSIQTLGPQEIECSSFILNGNHREE